MGRGAREGVRMQLESRDFVAIMSTYNQKQAHAEHGRLSGTGFQIACIANTLKNF